MSYSPFNWYLNIKCPLISLVLIPFKYHDLNEAIDDKKYSSVHRNRSQIHIKYHTWISNTHWWCKSWFYSNLMTCLSNEQEWDDTRYKYSSVTTSSKNICIVYRLIQVMRFDWSGPFKYTVFGMSVHGERNSILHRLTCHALSNISSGYWVLSSYWPWWVQLHYKTFPSGYKSNTTAFATSVS